MQHVEAATAPRIPPAAIMRALRQSGSLEFRSTSIVSVMQALAIQVSECKMRCVATTEARVFLMSDFTNARGYPIGEMSKRTGVNIETIRYYERIKIMPQPDRTAGGNRQYNYDHLKRLSFIKTSRELGFSIDEIRALLEMVDRQDFTCGEVHGLTIGHLESVREKIKGLRKLEKALVGMAAECSQGDVPDCPILETLFEAR
jgi:MerR family mercuric resistance operon transcriptional regulator